MTQLLEGPTVHSGEFSADSLVSGTASLTNAMFSSAAGARLNQDKAIHQFPVHYAQANGAAVTSATVHLHTARGAGNLVELHVVSTGVHPSSSDTVTVDIQRSTAGGAFATILSSTIELNSGGTVRVVQSTSSFVSSGAYLADDILIAVVTVSGSTAQGLGVTLFLAEQPT